jgi:hypothetical protein
VSVATSSQEGGRPARRRPPGRYDEPSRAVPRAMALLLSALFLALLVAIALNLYARYGAQDVSVRERGFDVVSDEQVRVDFDVTSPPGETAWCLVRARGADGAEVGREFVSVSPAEGAAGEQTVRHPLPTTERAVTGEVVRCLLQEPPADAPRAGPAPGGDP